MHSMWESCRHTQLGRKDHWILFATAGAVASLAFIVHDLVQQVLTRPEHTTGRVTVLILTVQSICCLSSFLGYVYRSLAGRPGAFTVLSVVAVVSNLCLLLIRVVHEILFSGYSPENYTDTPIFEDIFFQEK